MSTVPTVPLPTFEALGVTEDVLAGVDADATAQGWFSAFSEAAVATGSASGVAALFTTASPLWRDLLSLSWDFHTKNGVDKIRDFLDEHLVASGFAQLKLADGSVQLQKLAPNLAWITGAPTSPLPRRPVLIFRPLRVLLLRDHRRRWRRHLPTRPHHGGRLEGAHRLHFLGVAQRLPRARGCAA